MHNLILRGRTWCVRFIIPKDRWEDVGKATGARRGSRRDVVRTLGTRTKTEAIKRRPMALEAIRRELDLSLTQAGLKPLHGDWRPSWGMTDEEIVRDASEARKEMQSLSDKPRPSTREEDLSGEYIESPREERRGGWLDELDARVHALERVGLDGRAYAGKFLRVLDGHETPMGPLIDRWTREREATVSSSLVTLDRTALRLLADFIVYVAREHGDTKTLKGDPLASLRSRGIQSLSYRTLGEFPEWLMDHKGLSPKTTSCRISSLKSFWDWCIRKHHIDGPNPWDGATAGLKRRAEKQDKGKPDRRPFTTKELVRLFTTDPNEGRRWGWGAAIRDLMPLALFTGARVNELCSLTVDRIFNRDGSEGPLWGISVLDEEAKTKSSVRRVPLHPLVRPIIERRLKTAISTGAPDAPLFPECRPEKEGRKWSATFSQRFTAFRREVLGAASDGHTAFHSFRKNFITYMETALANGASECSELVRMHLSGHEPGDIGRKIYAARDLGWSVYEKAIIGMVEKGMPSEVIALMQSQ